MALSIGKRKFENSIAKIFSIIVEIIYNLVYNEENDKKGKEMMKVEAIIFDKDGTLLDFDAFWIAVSRKALALVLEKFNMPASLSEEILSAFGVRNGITSINGVLCKGTYEQMGGIVYDIMHRNGCNCSCDEVIRVVIAAYNESADAGEVKPTCARLAEILHELKRQNKRLAVVTTDNGIITSKCLSELGIEDLFDKIYTDDGITPTKPDPFCAFDFGKIYGIEKEKILMVGDTVTDARFAANAGISMVGLAKSEENREILLEHTNTVISEMTELLELLD